MILMNKIAIIGCGGAGKSVLSKKLGDLLSLPIHHLDCMFWQPGWLASEREDFIQKQAEVFTDDQWIMDGNYSGTLDIRLINADTIIFLDLSTIVCLRGLITRYFKYRNISRPDMTQGNNEKITLEFLNYVCTYRSRQRPEIMRKLNALRKSKNTVILKTRREIRSFLNAATKN